MVRAEPTSNPMHPIFQSISAFSVIVLTRMHSSAVFKAEVEPLNYSAVVAFAFFLAA